MSNLFEKKSDSADSSNVSYQYISILELDKRNAYLKESEGNLISTLEVERNNREEEETNPNLIA